MNAVNRIRTLSLGFGAAFAPALLLALLLALPAKLAWSDHLADDNLAAGEDIYNQTCVECHGEDGRGVVDGAPDFTKKGGRLTKPRAVLLDHILKGYKSPDSKTAMPPKGNNSDLTFQDIGNVLAYLEKDFRPEGNDVVAGAEIFDKTCVKCHGRDGRGAVAGAPDFTKPDGRLAKPRAELIKHILEGFQSPGSPTAMPPKGKNSSLTVGDVQNVLAFLEQNFRLKTFASAGEEIYYTTCVGCHGDEGTGEVEGTPDFTKEHGRLDLPDKVLIEHITDGYNSGKAAMPMPPKGGDEDLTLKQIWEVLSFLHQSFHYKIIK